MQIVYHLQIDKAAWSIARVSKGLYAFLLVKNYDCIKSHLQIFIKEIKNLSPNDILNKNIKDMSRYLNFEQSFKL